MRVLHIHNELENKGGAEVYINDLQALLPEWGCESYWIAIKNRNNGFSWAASGGEWKYSAKSELQREISAWVSLNMIDLICIHNLFDIELAKYIAAVKPTIKFSHSPVLVCPGKDKYWRNSNKPCTIPYGVHCFWHIYTEHCSNRHPKSVLNDWMYVRNELKNANDIYSSVIVMSDYNYDRLLECGVEKNKIINNPYFTPYKEVAEIKDPSQIEILFIGRLVKEKGVGELLDAVIPVLKSNSLVHLNVIGDGIMMDEMKEMVASHKLDSRVSFIGWLNRVQIDDYLSRCYLLVFPSTYPESFGIVGIEAMMFSKPVVAFDVGGISTWLKDKQTGFLVRPGNVGSMRVKIEELINDRALYNAMSQKAREFALREFLPERHIKLLLKTFNQAISGFANSPSN